MSESSTQSFKPGDLHGLPQKVKRQSTPSSLLNMLEIIHGPTGSGKTTSILDRAEALGLEVVRGDSPKKIIQDARHPSFFGQGRIALLEAEYFTKSEWNAVRASLTASPPQMVIEVQHLETVPYAIRRVAKSTYNPAPSKAELTEYLLGISHHLGINEDEDIIREVAAECKSWNTAYNSLITFGDGYTTDGITEPDVTKAILTGVAHESQTIHPIAVLKSALYNNENPIRVQQAHELHSRAWTTEDLSMVSWDNVKLLRSRTRQYRKPPYHKTQGSYRQAA